MKSEKKRSKYSRASQRRTKESKIDPKIAKGDRRSRIRSKEVKEYQKSASVSKITKKADESGSRISKNIVREVVPSVSNESTKTRYMREEKCKSFMSSGAPLGERNILRSRVNILQKLSNG